MLIGAGLVTREKYRADRSVVGHRRRPAIREGVSGSTSQRLVAHANWPILVRAR